MSFKDKLSWLLGTKLDTKKVRALFLLKKREDYNTDLANFNNFTVMTGMYNSSTFVSDMLNSNGIESKVKVLTDNNDIDRAVTEYKPTHVFIEGLWVVPEKFNVLKPLHPEVQWVVRIHSEIPFLAQEGIAIDWIHEYIRNGIHVSGNSPRINRELTLMLNSAFSTDCTVNVPMLTNYYPVPSYVGLYLKEESDVVNIGCFGAMRPLKNHLIQALAAIEFAEFIGKKLRFHINAGRIEMNGGNSLKNIKALFEKSGIHELVEHDWTSHDKFLELTQEMDICMQVSFTETFNIVTADATVSGIPVLTSKEVQWVRSPTADPTNTVDIVAKLLYAWNNKEYVVKQNAEGLRNYVRDSESTWITYLKG